jgi:hypothetical protein
MKGWGSVSLVLALGVFMGAGCGGRTGALDDGYGYEPNDQAGNGSGNNGSGGAVGTAGRPDRAGARNTGGAGPIPTGGVSFGGSYVTAGAYSGGAYPGGAYPGGYGFGGTTGIAGSFMMGGFGGSPYDDCQSCIFETCGDTLSQCLQDFGCISILACTQATGCQAFQCYNPRACGPVIDQWGGPGGPSMSMLLETFSCVVTSGCPCN